MLAGHYSPDLVQGVICSGARGISSALSGDRGPQGTTGADEDESGHHKVAKIEGMAWIRKLGTWNLPKVLWPTEVMTLGAAMYPGGPGHLAGADWRVFSGSSTWCSLLQDSKIKIG